MTGHIRELEHRFASLERRNTALVYGLLLLVVLAVATALSRGLQAQPQPADQPLRVRSLFVEDAERRPRILLGSPIPDRNAGGNPRTGMIINDADGVERFGLSLMRNDRVVMGFDAPRGKGDDRNRERITIVADENGGGYIRFLGRRTSVPARMFLDDDNRVWLEFNEVQPNEIVRRRIGFSGDQQIREPC